MVDIKFKSRLSKPGAGSAAA